jgi:hypothetical protein
MEARSFCFSDQSYFPFAMSAMCPLGEEASFMAIIIGSTLRKAVMHEGGYLGEIFS